MQQKQAAFTYFASSMPKLLGEKLLIGFYQRNESEVLDGTGLREPPSFISPRH